MSNTKIEIDINYEKEVIKNVNEKIKEDKNFLLTGNITTKEKEEIIENIIKKIYETISPAIWEDGRVKGNDEGFNKGYDEGYHDALYDSVNAIKLLSQV